MELAGYQIRTARINSLLELSRGSSVVTDMLQTGGSEGGVEKAGRTQGGEARCPDNARQPPAGDRQQSLRFPLGTSVVCT